MRTVCDWRDLPSVPRRAVSITPTSVANQSCDRDATPAKLGKKARRKRSRFSDLCESQQNTADEHIIVPRKRPRTSPDNHGHSDEQPCSGHVQMQTSSQPSSRSEDFASKSLANVSHHSSKQHCSSPASDSNTVFDDTDNDSCDGEAVRRVIRHPRSQMKPSPSGNSVSKSTNPVASASLQQPAPSPMKDSVETPREADNDSSDEEAILRVILRQRSHVKTPHLQNHITQNSNSTLGTSCENLISSPVSVSSTTPCHEAEDSSDEEVIRRVPRRRRRPVKPSHSTNCSAQSTDPVSNASPKDLVSNPVSYSGRTPCDEADDSSDEETVLRGTRRRRRPMDALNSGDDERQIRSCSLSSSQGDLNCSSSDHEDRSVLSRKSRKKRRADASSDEKRAKRRRTNLSLESDIGKQRKCRKSSSLKPISSSVEPSLQNSSRDSKPEMRPRKTCTYRAQRRRCARQSTTRSRRVPWYMLDEERRPYRLRSSSSNCAARCIFWTKTERRLFTVGKSPIHNRGLYALEDIPAFAPVIEYAGEVVTQVQSEIREWEYQSRHMDEVYMYQLRKGTTDVIDGTKRGGPSKFVNHSCEPNVVADEIQAGGTNRVWFFSLRPIRKHEEILVDYCLSYEPGDVKRPCMCGTRKCKKYLNYYGLTD